MRLDRKPNMPIEYYKILRPHFCLVTIIISLVFNQNVTAGTEEEATTTPEPGPAPGCRAPDIRFTVVKPETATEQPFAKFETTPSDDFSLGDVDIADKINIDLSGRSTHQLGGNVNPYQVDIAGNPADEQMMAIEGELDYTMDVLVLNRKRLKSSRRGKKRPRISSPRNRRLENENTQNHERVKRQVIRHDPEASPNTDRWDGSKLAAEGDVYYVYIDDILKSSSLSNELRMKLDKLKKLKTKKTKFPQKSKTSPKEHIISEMQSNETPDYNKNITERQVIGEIPTRETTEITNQKRQNKHNSEKYVVEDLLENGMVKFISDAIGLKSEIGNLENDTVIMMINKDSDLMSNVFVIDELLQRVKRKSGKTAGALGRSKGGGESSSKTTSRKDKGILDEEGGYAPVHVDESDDDEEEEEEEIDIQQQFTEVSEIRFPGEIGPLGDRRLCKISCIKGKWAGPLCATNEEDNNGNVKFQPLYKSCHVNRIPPHLLLSYRNISVTLIPSSKGFHRNRTSRPVFVSHTQISVGWDLPHGHSFQARCKELGLYKLLGEPRVVCSDGMWHPRMPSCVPTSLLTNFSEDSAPSIRYKIKIGSAAFEPSGVLAILPGSTIILDCIYPRVKGNPEWTWSIWFVQYPTGWSNAPDEKNLCYRLTIKNINRGDTGTFTCTSPRGLTNSVTIFVANSTCPRLSQPLPPLTLRLEGNKLGQKALYRCPPGFRVEGEMNSTCLASGNWSSPPPTCQAVQCPRLTLDDPHLSLVELNTSAFGRAVFKCQWGFKLTGPIGLECKPYGEWNGPVPRCQEILCSLPTPPLNGRISGSNISRRRLTVGALITFSCNEGHSLVGEPSIICTETGYWSHPPPFCKSQCPYPGDPLNGLIAPLKFNYDSGDYLTVQCRPGFVQYSEKGPPERPICQPDGSWSAPVPKCRSYEEV